MAHDKIVRLCSLAKRADMKVGIDNTQNLRKLSEVAQAQGVTLGVLIEVDTSMHRAGIRRVEDGVELAKPAATLPGIAFRGLMSHQTLPGRPDKQTRLIEGRRFMQMCLDLKEAIEGAGIPVDIVSTGETWTYDIAADLPGVTEIQGGTYVYVCLLWLHGRVRHCCQDSWHDHQHTALRYRHWRCGSAGLSLTRRRAATRGYAWGDG